ncbi:MAG: universal stress protein [Anaerolineales bacterium]|nr:universal stress protein [Anaerolineales bacterium]
MSGSDQRIDAVVTPMRAGGVRTTFIWTGVVILGSVSKVVVQQAGCPVLVVK